MACGCENKKAMSELARVSGLARRAAIMEKCVYVVFRKADGTYSFDRYGTEINGLIVEYRHYL